RNASVFVTSPSNQSYALSLHDALPIWSFSDSNGNATSWFVDVNWGDGTPDTTFTTNSRGSLGNAFHTFGEEGTFTVRVTVTDNLDRKSTRRNSSHVANPYAVVCSINIT